MSRTDRTEQIGVNAVEQIVLNDFLWIFRKQPNPDFGIDAQIEFDDTDSPKNYPTGKLIALQIKTGPSHVNIGERILTYSTSWVHYHYWLSSNIPVIFIIHFPKTGKTYWQHITKANFKFARKNMVLQIPKKQRFCKYTKNALVNILQIFKPETSSFNILKGKTRPTTIYDAILNVKYIEESSKCFFEIADIMTHASDVNKKVTRKFSSFIEQDLKDNSPVVQAQIDTLGISINITSKKIETQIELFIEQFTLGLTSWEFILQEIHKHNFPYNYELTYQVISDLALEIPNLISSTEYTKNSFDKMPKKYPVLREARINIQTSLTILTKEMSDVLKLTKALQKQVEKYLSNKS